MNSGQETILGIHSGALGDVVLFARLLGELAGSITLVAGGEKAKMLAALGAADRAVDFDSMPMHEIFSDTPVEHCRLGKLLGSHDRLVSCFATDNSEAQARLSALCGATSTAMLPIRPPADCGGHLLDLWRDMLGLADSGSCAGRAWSVPPEWRRQSRRQLSDMGVDTSTPVVVIHPGAGGQQKCWPVQRFVELARLVEGNHGARVVFVLGPVECEQWDHGQIADLDAEFALMRAPTLAMLAGILATAKAFVGNDSGPSHLAAALGTPTVAIFGPTRAEHFSPRGTAVVTVSHDSLSKINVRTVFGAINKSTHLPGRPHAE